MKNNKFLRMIIVLLILLLFSLFCFLLYLVVMYNLNGSLDNKINVTTTNNEDLTTAEEILKEYDCIFWKQDGDHIYVTFSKDLFDENMESNENYFKSIVKGLERFFINKDFYLIDYNNSIEIHARYNAEKEKYELIINNVEDYFNNVEGKDYIGIDNINNPKESNTIHSIDTILTNLKANGMKFSSIKMLLGEGEELDDGYVSYLDGTVKLRLVNNGIVRNIVFSRNYKDRLFKNFDNKATLEEIYINNPNNFYGGTEEGYLGYRTDELYYFIYEDEISIYGYSYSKNTLFENTLKKYIENNNLEKFIKLIMGQLPTYDYCEYDEQNQNANIMFSSYGIEVNIKNNNPKGVILYNNYYFTDYTKKLVKNGYVTFKNNESSIEKVEIERRNKGR